MKKILVGLFSSICALAMMSCQGSRTEKPTLIQQGKSALIQQIKPKLDTVKDVIPIETLSVHPKKEIDTIYETKTGQRAEICYLTKSQYDSLYQSREQYTFIPETLYDRKYAYWDLPESNDSIRAEWDSLMTRYPVVGTVWKKWLKNVVTSEFDTIYYQTDFPQDAICTVEYYRQTNYYMMTIWQEHTAWGFWVKNESVADTILLVTSDCVYNGTFLAGLVLADCDYCTNIHIYRRNPSSQTVEEVLNYINTSFDSTSLCWIASNQLLCKCKYRSGQNSVFFTIKIQ